MKKIIRSVVVLIILFFRSMIYTEETKGLQPELVVNSGHGDHVMSIVFNPDNKLAATMSETAIIIWDVESGRQIKAFKKNRFERPHHDVRFSEDSRSIVFYNRYPHNTDQIIDVIDMETWEYIINIREKEAVPYLAINHDKTMFAYGFGKTVKVYDMKTGKELFSLGGFFSGHKSNVSIVAFSPDSSTLASASKDGQVILWNLKNKKEFEKLPSAVSYMTDMLFTGDGKGLLIATYDKLINWNIIEGQEENSHYTLNSPEILELIKNRSSILLGDDGRYINGSSSSKALGIGNMNKRISKSITLSLNESEFNQRDVQSLTGISSDVKILAICLKDNTVMLIDTDSGKKITALNRLNFTEKYSSQFLLLSPDRRIIITGEAGNNYVFRDTATGKQLFSIKPEDNHKPDETEIYFIHDSRVHFPVKQFTHNHYINTKTWKIESEPLTKLYLPDGRNILDGGKESKTGRILFGLQPFQSRFYCVTPDSKYFAQMYVSLEIWDIIEGKIHLKINKDIPKWETYRVFSTPDSRRIVLVSKDEANAPEDTMRVWDIETGKLILTGKFGDRYIGYDDKYMIQFSPDSKYVIIPVKNENNNLLVYDFTTWKKLYTLTGYSPVFTSNNTLVIRLNNTISMLDMKTGKTIGNAVFFKDNFVIAAADGRYEAAGEGSGYLHWVSGLEVIPLDRLDKSYQRKGLLASLFEGTASDLNSNSHAEKKDSGSSVDISKQLIGRVGALSGNDIFVNSSRAAELIRMGDKLFLIVNGKKIYIQAVFPMMTTVRCKALKQLQIKEIKKGMPVFR